MPPVQTEQEITTPHERTYAPRRGNPVNPVNPVKNINSFFVAYPAKGFTFAHELVHILTDEGHSSRTWNLMYKDEAVSNTPLAPKRLTQAQETLIRNSDFVK